MKGLDTPATTTAAPLPVLTVAEEMAALSESLKASAPGETRRALVAQAREVIDRAHGGHTLEASLALSDFLFGVVTS